MKLLVRFFIEYSISTDFYLDGPVLSLPQRATLGWSRTFDTFRQWSTRTLKYTRQIIQERFGNVTRTQDIELEQNIQVY